MKSKYLIMKVIILSLCVIGLPVFAFTVPVPDPPPEGPPPVQTEDTFTGAEADQQMRISTGYVTPIEENMPSEHLTPDITSQGESTTVSDQSQGQSTEPPVKPTETIKTLEGSSINPY